MDTGHPHLLMSQRTTVATLIGPTRDDAMTARRLIKLTLYVGLILIALPVVSANSMAGDSLTQALQHLQRRGLNLVFSSNVVKDTMRTRLVHLGA